MNINESVRYVNYVLRNTKYYREIIRRRVILGTLACICLFVAGISAVGSFTQTLTYTQNLISITPFIFSLCLFAIITYAFSKSTRKMFRINIDHRAYLRAGHRNDQDYLRDIKYNLMHMPPLLKLEMEQLELKDANLHRALETLRNANVAGGIITIAA